MAETTSLGSILNAKDPPKRCEALFAAFASSGVVRSACRSTDVGPEHFNRSLLFFAVTSSRSIELAHAAGHTHSTLGLSPGSGRTKPKASVYHNHDANASGA